MLLFDDSKKLEKALGEEAAAVIAHVLEKADDKWRRDLATKADLADMENRIIKWMMGGFIALGAFLIASMAFLK
ncbi:hypothetical protein LJC09_01830 [Desulfovibrio sp. OttesenSCG-928-F20]|nr:hypothetical protein [Desulfovibrio sp. OttesenSCG-928-F20]